MMAARRPPRQPPIGRNTKRSELFGHAVEQRHKANVNQIFDREAALPVASVAAQNLDRPLPDRCHEDTGGVQL